jgi:hypothetical protein
LFIYIGGCDALAPAPPSEPPRQEPILMSDPAGPAGAEQASPCCAAIAELQQRAARRTARHIQADSGEDPVTSSPDPARDA